MNSLEIQVLDAPEDSQNFFKDRPELQFFKFFSRNAPRSYLVALKENKIVGIICYNESSSIDPSCYGIGYVEVIEKNQGVASRLCQVFFDKAKSNNKGIRTGSFEPEGRLFLKKVLKRLSIEKNVRLLEF